MKALRVRLTVNEQIQIAKELNGVEWTVHWAKMQGWNFDTVYFALFGRWPTRRTKGSK